MLTKMAEEGADFDEVLKDAQEKGYAEKDPTADIEGHDPCRKIAILTSLVCGRPMCLHSGIPMCANFWQISRWKNTNHAEMLYKYKTVNGMA